MIDDVEQQLRQKESDMEDTISEFVAGEITIFEMKERLNMLEKDTMDIV